MQPIISSLSFLLTKTATTLHILSVAVAAVSTPAIYDINPQDLANNSHVADFGGLDEVLTENPTQAQVRAFIAQSARRHGISEFMALYIAENESHFNQYAVGDTHLTCKRTGKPIRSRGIWQINDCAWPEVSDVVAFDIKKSTEWAMPKLKETPEIWSTYKRLLKSGQFEL